MGEDDIRGLNIDFNYNNYGVFYEKLEEEEKKGGAGADEQLSNGEDEKPKTAAANALTTTSTGFQKLISEKNLLTKMWQNADVDLELFKERYEEWLEEEVWTYYD